MAYANVLNPYDATVKFNMAMLKNQQGDMDKAHVLIEKALMLEPYNPLFLLSFAELMKKAGNDSLAQDYLKKAIRVSPSILTSSVINEIWNLSEANQELLIELSEIADPSMDVMSLSRLATICFFLGEYSRSKKLFEDVVEKIPNLNRPWMYLGQMALLAGDTAGFKSSIHRALLLDGQDYMVNNLLADFHLNKGENTDAIYYIKRCLQLYMNPRTPYFVMAKGIYNTSTLHNPYLPSSSLYKLNDEIDLNAMLSKLLTLYRSEGMLEQIKLIESCISGELPIDKIMDLL